MSTPHPTESPRVTIAAHRYEILGELGQGGMATVSLARTVGAAGFERLVVIKRLHSYLTSDETAVRRFLNEAHIAGHVHHANVVGIQHVGCDDEGYFLVFDYIEGDSLQGLMDRARKRGVPIPPRVVVRILLDALAGLHAAHETEDTAGRPLGVLHRDVTPQNVLIGRDGVTRLTDFGVAKAALAAPTTEAGSLVGKVLYMPPEYLRREKIDRRVDIYGMGVTAWVALTGVRPWSTTSEGGLVLKIVTEGVPALGTVIDTVSKGVEQVVMRACHKDPEGRYLTARGMAEALDESARRGEGVATHAEVSAYIEELFGQELSTRRLQAAAGPASPRLVTGGFGAPRRVFSSQPGSRAPAVSGDGLSSLPLAPFSDDLTRPDLPATCHDRPGTGAHGISAATLASSPPLLAGPRARRWPSAMGVAIGIAAMTIGLVRLTGAPARERPVLASGMAEQGARTAAGAPQAARVVAVGEVSSASVEALAAPAASSAQPGRPSARRSAGAPSRRRGQTSEVMLTNPYTAP